MHTSTLLPRQYMADLQIDIEEFPLWFAETLSAAVKTDLTGVMALLRSIQSTINSIHNISVSLREVAAAQPQAAAQLSARCIKLCDQLDTYLVQQFGSAPPILPGASHVTELCQRLKNRIKTVDDMASSSKLTKSDEIIQSKLTSLRNHFHDLQSQIEDLEALHSNKSIVTEFIDEVKVPLDALSKLLEERARLSEGKSSRERVIEIHGSISSQRSRGSAALCNEAMHRWIVLQELRARLEIALSDMLSCIHAMFNQSKGQASLAPEHKGLRAVFGGAQSARDSVRLPEFRDNVAQISTELRSLLTSPSLASAIEACSLSPAAAATATVLAENAEDVIACLAEWRDVVKEIESLEASSEFRTSQADVAEAAARVRADEQALSASIKALSHDRDRRRTIDSQLEGHANILLTVCKNDLGIGGIQLKL